MSKRLLDQQPRHPAGTPLKQYMRAARGNNAAAAASDPRIVALQRRAKGPFNPTRRMRAFLRIERGIRA